MAEWGRFARRLETVEDVPEPFQHALRAKLSAEDSVRLLIFGPRWVSLRSFSPATVLAITDRQWVVVSEQQQGGVDVASSGFANTLLVELTIILLYGNLRIEFAAAGKAQSVKMEFNAVMERLYEQALPLILDKMDGVCPAPQSDSLSEHTELLEGFPFKFRNAVSLNLPAGQRLLAAEYRRPVYGRKTRLFQHELVPEGLLALTDRELLLLSEEKTWSWTQIGRQTKYGNVATHCPLSRLAGFRLTKRQQIVTVELEMCAPKGGGAVAFDFSPAQRDAVMALMNRAVQARAAGV
jgi:hypothetical protein